MHHAIVVETIILELYMSAIGLGSHMGFNGVNGCRVSNNCYSAGNNSHTCGSWFKHLAMANSKIQQIIEH